jgi:hypothetical protein
MFFKKETKVQELIQKHVQIVGEAVNSWKEAFSYYLEENKEDFQAKTLAVVELESKADEVRKEAQLVLYQGAYLPIFREDLLDFLELTDNIADDAEKGVDFLKIENPVILPSWNEEIKTIVGKSQQAFIFFQEAFAILFKERSTALSSTHRVQRAEKEVEELQDDLLEKIFQSQLSLAHKLQIRDLILTIGHVSDSSENASDKVALMAIKGRI